MTSTQEGSQELERTPEGIYVCRKDDKFGFVAVATPIESRVVLVKRGKDGAWGYVLDAESAENQVDGEEKAAALALEFNPDEADLATEGTARKMDNGVWVSGADMFVGFVALRNGFSGLRSGYNVHKATTDDPAFRWQDQGIQETGFRDRLSADAKARELARKYRKGAGGGEAANG